jgi:hypothetical protein
MLVMDEPYPGQSQRLVEDPFLVCRGCATHPYQVLALGSYYSHLEVHTARVERLVEQSQYRNMYRGSAVELTLIVHDVWYSVLVFW